MTQKAVHIHPQQMEAWISKLQDNIRKFLDNTAISKEDKLIFIRQQYMLINTVNSVLDGKAHFVGCSHFN